MKNIISVKKLIYLSVFSMPFYLIKFSLFGVPINILEVLIGTTFLIWLWKKKEFSWKVFCNSYKIYLVGIFLIFSGLIISILINGNYLTGLGIVKSWFAFPLILAFVMLNEIESRKDMKNVLRSFYFSAVMIGVVSLIYFLKGSLTYDFRLKAFYLSPNYLAMFLAPAIFIGNYLIDGLRLTKKRITIILLLISQSIILLVIYFTYSYATWVAVILSLVIITLIKQSDIFKKIKVVLVLLVLFLAILITQTNNPKFSGSFDWQATSRSSLVSRIVIWKSAGKILQDSPLWGVGPGNFQDKYLEYQKYFPPYLEWAVPQPHNLYLAFWLQCGILGLIGFLWLIFLWLKGMKDVIKNKIPSDFLSEAKKSRRDFGKISLVLLGMMLCVLIHGWADTTYWKNDLAVVFWVIFSLGLIVVGCEKHKS